jgi:tight adherence protein B
MSPILYVLVFLTAILGLEGIYAMMKDRSRTQRAASDRLAKIARNFQSPVVGRDDREKEESILRGRESDDDLIDRLLLAMPGARSVSLTLYRAGSATTLRRFLLTSLAIALAGAVAGAVFIPGRGLLFAFVGFLPWINVRRQKAKRMALFEKQLPDALDLLVRALRAGHSLTTAMQMVGAELPDPIGIEFSHVAQEISLGMNTKDALDNLAFRVESEDLPFFVTAISIQQETGSNLAEILENLSHVIRERFKVLGKVRALTSMGRASANILAIWPCVMVGAIYLSNPSYVAPLWETEAGGSIVITSIIMIVVGYFICRKMATIRV